MRAARDRAQKSADVISAALADRLRIDGSPRGRKRSLLARRQGAPTAEEQRELELIRSSPLFDAAWYLRDYHDVVRSGEEPGLHFLRHPTRPIRAPGPRLRHRALPRRHTPRFSRRASTRWSTSCSSEEGGAQTATRPKSEHAGPRDRPAAVRRLPATLARVRPAVAARRPTRTPPGPAALVERALAEGLPEPEQPRACRTAAPNCAARWPSSGRAAPSTRHGYVEANRPATRRIDPLLHFVDRGLARPAGAQPGLRPLVVLVQLPRPDGRGREPAAPLPPRRAARGPRARSPALLRRDAHARTTPDRPRAAPACSPAYDRDGVVDDYVVDYLRELARHADVFYLADGVLESGELDKLEGITRGPGASRTRRTTSAPGPCWPATWSAGSGSRSYDEVVLANDSCFLVRPLDDVFAEMDRSRRATGGACRRRRWSSTRTTSASDASMPLDEAQARR